jgi:uncharacterized protein YciI
MRILITFEVFETLKGKDEVKRVREAANMQLQQVQNSGKLVEGGMFGDRRGGFLILDIDKTLDLYELLGSAILDSCRVESHPVLSFRELGEFFKSHPVGE